MQLLSTIRGAHVLFLLFPDDEAATKEKNMMSYKFWNNFA